MLLTIDTGNTETVLGLFDGADLVSHWRVSTNAERTSDEHALLVSDLLGLEGYAFEETVTGISISSTVPSLTATLREMTSRWFDVPTVVLETGVRTGMPILIDNPKELGPDRVANSIGAYELYGGPTICVDFGTATTFDCVSAQGEYLGGAILPGIGISMDALFGRAAALRRVELIEPRNVIGKNTVESIQSGAVYGFTGSVEAIVRRIEGELGECTVIATGGWSGLIAPLTDSIQHYEPWITLHGLRVVFERNR
ncbi:MAG TPA: type III pantothenate kinase [Acidimicrobiales bacterium]|nr:type III pantothenate kinase [Acidimicrobiales bacterium]